MVYSDIDIKELIQETVIVANITIIDDYATTICTNLLTN